jgi:hypothetical protein
MSPSRVITASACLLCAGALAACVTESVTPATGRSTGMKVRPGSPAASNKSAAKPMGASGEVVSLPDGPVAAPATGKTTSSRVEVGVVPLGLMNYDGQALPQVSPDGRFVAVQQGSAPTWEAILAEPTAAPPEGSGIGIYAVGEHELKRIAPPQDLPSGLLIGRAADDHGFLVEAPQADGSRWIGQVTWSGAFKWLVQGPLVNAHATLTPRGELLFTSRAVESDTANLVIQGPRGDQTSRSPGEGTYAFPMCTADPDAVYVFRLAPAAMEVIAIRLDRGADAVSGDRTPSFGATIARRAVAPKGDMTLAFQMASTVQPALPLGKGATGGHGELALWHPRTNRMSVFSLDTASFEPLAARSFAGIPSEDAGRPGYFCATQDGLVFSPPIKPGQDETSVRVVAGAFMPRRLRANPQSMMLFGAVKGRPDQFEVVRLVVGPEKAQAGKS